MHELAVEGTFTKVLLQLRNADGEFLSKFCWIYKIFSFKLPPICLPQSLDTIQWKIYLFYNSIKLKI